MIELVLIGIGVYYAIKALRMRHMSLDTLRAHRYSSVVVLVGTLVIMVMNQPAEVYQQQLLAVALILLLGASSAFHDAIRVREEEPALIERNRRVKAGQ